MSSPTATARTVVYALGSNSHGQLGLGHVDDQSIPQPCKFVSFPDYTIHSYLPDSSGGDDDDTVQKLVAGGNHTLILTQQGRLYAAGNNAHGQCGITPADYERVSEFTPVSWAQANNVTDVAATWEATIFVVGARTVWACGFGSKGELGMGADVVQSHKPRLVFDAEEGRGIVGISGGMSHVIVWLDDGSVYGWGGCRKGQLGMDPNLCKEKSVWVPQLIKVPDSRRATTSNVVTGRDFTLIKHADHDCTLLGELKTTDDDESHFNAAVVQSSMYTAGWSTVYTLSQGIVQGFGPGRRGQLPPKDLHAADKIAAGSEHCVALLADGKVVTWGWGEHGNCGLPVNDRGNVVDGYNILSIPTDTEQIVVGIGAGCATTFIWTQKPIF